MTKWNQVCCFLRFVRSLNFGRVLFSDNFDFTTVGFVLRWTSAHTVLTCLHIVVLSEYWISAESRKPLKPMLGGMSAAALSIKSHEPIQ